MDLKDMFSQIEPDNDWDKWDCIEALFRVWLDNTPEYKVYRESNAMIHFLRAYYTPIITMLNNKLL